MRLMVRVFLGGTVEHGLCALSTSLLKNSSEDKVMVLPWLALITEIVFWHCIRADPHTLNMLPYTTRTKSTLDHISYF